MKSRIYFLHEYGEPSHVFALHYFLQQNGVELKYRELNIVHQLKQSIVNLNTSSFLKLIKNMHFFVFLIFTKKQKILLSIAPYNYILVILNFILRKHDVYYFTSYTCWDQTRMAHSMFYSDWLLNKWRFFLQKRVKHIFVVSSVTKNELIKNGFSEVDNISVVHHSYKEKILPDHIIEKNNKFIYVGRLTFCKGIDDLLCFFSKNKELSITFVGDGELGDKVKEYALEYSNIHYRGFINGLNNIIPIYKQHSFLILNSKRTDSWEELFGLTIIEAMACGLIPITTDHTGPKEIITHMYDGIIATEEDIMDHIYYAANMSQEDFSRMRENAIKRSLNFTSSSVSIQWRKILD